MMLFTPRGVVRASRDLLSSFARLKSRIADLVSFARSWQWGAVVGRVVLAGLGLALLGAIGRSALARNVLSSEPTASPDAGMPVIAAPPLAPQASAPSASPATLANVVAPSPAAPAEPPAATSTAESSSAPTATSRGRATPEDPVYLNQATIADLHRLPGVGPKRAEAILALRTKLGHFRQIEDLLKVKGIGRSSLRKLRPLVRLDPPPVKTNDGGVSDAHAYLYDSAPFTRAMSAPMAPSFRSMCS